MKLKRGFIDVKRLATIGINKVVRTPWLLDYVKCIAKTLEYSNNLQIETNDSVANYVLYNGQKLVLKTFVDDYYDIVDRRTLIEENREEDYSFYGYVNDSGTYYDEIDPNPTTLNGYITSAFTYVLESPIATNPTIYGYIKFESLEALQDVDLEYITDNYDEFIYTSENSEGTDRYIYYLETQSDEGLIIYLYEDIYNALTQQELDNLLDILGRYIISPIRYKIESYN